MAEPARTLGWNPFPAPAAVNAEPFNGNPECTYCGFCSCERLLSRRERLDSALQIWQTLLDERLAGMTMFGRHLLDTRQLRPGIGLDEVRDVLWTYIAVELYELLVIERGLDRTALRRLDRERDHRRADRMILLGTTTLRLQPGRRTRISSRTNVWS